MNLNKYSKFFKYKKSLTKKRIGTFQVAGTLYSDLSGGVWGFTQTGKAFRGRGFVMP